MGNPMGGQQWPAVASSGQQWPAVASSGQQWSDRPTDRPSDRQSDGPCVRLTVRPTRSRLIHPSFRLKGIRNLTILQINNILQFNDHFIIVQINAHSSILQTKAHLTMLQVRIN